jgi:hypothetical protein
MNPNTTPNPVRERAQPALVCVAGTGLLLYTWCVLYFLIGAPNTLSDALGRLPYALRLENLVLVISLLLLLVRLARGRHRAWIPLDMGLRWLLPGLGYPPTWPVVVVEVGLLLALLGAQAGGWLRGWLRRGGAASRAVVGMACGTLLFVPLAAGIALVEHKDALIWSVQGLGKGAIIGVLVGLMARPTSRRWSRLVLGAAIGAFFGWAPGFAPVWPLAGAGVGILVAVIARAERALLQRICDL